ncbi:MFS transporter [Bifidobacterium sp. 82T10]|uniref:MFS transporter n=1 Tax=Bifidobacterium miconis TaxID=2834435 RepID=A0ABS6WEX4_9BIFI|nr:MFS transporter [Bifidobacterium miconis]MBW3092594.1 MFS transporter [Bifidobacterium miconis]
MTRRKRKPKPDITPFTRREALAYGFGDIGGGFSFTLSTSYLLLYCTNVLGVDAAIIGMILFMTKLCGAFVDLALGRYLDSLPLTRTGRYLHWLSAISYPLSASIALLYCPLAGLLPVNGRIAWVVVAYVLMNLCFAVQQISYGSLASVVSERPSDREAVSAARGAGSAVGTILGSCTIPLAVYVTVDGVRQISSLRFWLVAILCAALIWICAQVVVHTMHERIRSERSRRERVPFPRMLLGLVSSRSMIGIVLATFAVMLTGVIFSSVNTYVFADYFRNPGALAVAQTVPAILSLAVAPVAPRIAARFGKRESNAAMLLATAAIYVVMYLMHIRDAWTFVVMLVLASVGSGYFGLMTWSYITDVVDDRQVATGSREDATVYSAYQFARGIGSSLAGGLGGVVVTLCGYVPSVAGHAVTQSDDVLERLYAVDTLVPAAGYALVALTLLAVYPLSKRRLQDNQRILAERNHRERNAT